MATFPVVTDGSESGGGSSRAKPKRPRQTYKPTEEEIEVAVERGKKTQQQEVDTEVMRVLQGLSADQWEGIRSGQYTIGYDDKTKKASYAAVPGKHPDFPVLKEGAKTAAQQARETGSGARLERTVARDLSYLGVPGMAGVFGMMGVGAKLKSASKTAAAEAYGIPKNAVDLLPPAGQELKVLGGIDELTETANVSKVKNEAQRLYGQRFESLNPYQQTILVEAVRRGVKLQPSRQQKAAAAARRQQADDYVADRTKREGIVEGVQQDILNNPPTSPVMVAEDTAAAATQGLSGAKVSTPAPRPTGGTTRTAQQTTGQAGQRKKAAEQLTGTELDEEAAEALAQTGKAPAGTTTPAAGKKLSDVEQAERLAHFDQQKVRLKKLAARQETTKAKKAFEKALGKLSKIKISPDMSADEVAKIYAEIQELELKLVGNPGSKLIDKAAKQTERLGRSFNSWGNKNRKVREAFAEAAKNRASREAVLPKNAIESRRADAAAKGYENLTPAQQARVRQRVEELSGTPFRQLNPQDQRNFIFRVFEEPVPMGTGRGALPPGSRSPASGKPVTRGRALGAETGRARRAEQQARLAEERANMPPTPRRTGEQALRETAGAGMEALRGLPAAAWRNKGEFPWMVTAAAGVPAVGAYAALDDAIAEMDAADAEREQRNAQIIADAASAEAAAAQEAKIDAAYDKAQWFRPVEIDGKVTEPALRAMPPNWLEFYTTLHKQEPALAKDNRYATFLNLNNKGQTKEASQHAFVHLQYLANRFADTPYAEMFEVDVKNGKFQPFDLDAIFPRKKVK